MSEKIKRQTSKGLIWLLLAALILPAMVSTESFWIDESQTFTYIKQPDTSSLFYQLKIDQNSEGLMPLAMVSAWVGGQTFGKAEWQLRASNIFWMILALWALWRAGGLIDCPWLPLLAAIHPFVWAFTNEARPYAMQIAGGSIILAGFLLAVDRRENEKQWMAFFFSGAVLLSATSLLGVIPAGVAGAVLLPLLWKKGWRPSRVFWLFVAIAGCIMAPLGLFYITKLQQGAAGSRIWTVGISNIFSVVYEFSGFMGLGPARQEMRSFVHDSKVLQNLRPYLLPMIGLAFGLAGVLITGLLNRWQKVRLQMFWTLALATCLMLVGMFVLSTAADFPFWGRHLAGAFPFFLAATGLWIQAAWSSKIQAARVAVIVTILFFTISGLELRFNPRHAKDNYREAAAIAKSAMREGKVVWWAADPPTADYYKIVLGKNEWKLGEALYVNSPDATRTTKIAQPDLIVLSKTDIYDTSGAIRKFISEHSLKLTHRLQSFTIWETTSK